LSTDYKLEMHLNGNLVFVLRAYKLNYNCVTRIKDLLFSTKTFLSKLQSSVHGFRMSNLQVLKLLNLAYKLVSVFVFT